MSGLLRILPFVTAILCGGGAAESFKERHPVVGVPMFVLGVAAFGVWLVFWLRAQSKNLG